MTNTEISVKAKEYKELTQFIKQLQDEAEQLKDEITAEMETQKTDKFITDLFTVTWTEYKSSRLDTNKLKAEHADLYSVYSKTVTAKRFQVA